MKINLKKLFKKFKNRACCADFFNMKRMRIHNWASRNNIPDTTRFEIAYKLHKKGLLAQWEKEGIIEDQGNE